jgi:hypothetical protein
MNCELQKNTNRTYLKFFDHIQLSTKSLNAGRDGIVGITTAYGLDGPGIESRWGRDFPYLSRLALRITQPPVRWVPGLSQREGAVEA